MAYPTPMAFSGPVNIDRRENALTILFILLTIAVLALRFLVTPELMNRFMSYSTEGGSFYEKIHLATYATLALFPAVLASRMNRPRALTGEDAGFLRVMLRYAAAMGVFVIYFALSGRLSAIGFLIETYLIAVLAAIVLILLQSGHARRIVASAVLCLLIASAFIAIIEVTLQRNLISSHGGWEAFRAYGLSSHPLALGAQCVLAIGFVPLTRWPRWVKVSAIFLLILGCVAANARTALAVSLLETLLLILFLRWGNLSRRRELQAKLMTLFAALVLGSALAILFLSFGLLSRFNAVIDDSSLARLQIYTVFDYVSWKDILLGMDATELMRVVNEKVGLPYIESAPVFFILLMGLPMAILFTGIVIGYILRLFRGTAPAARIGTILLILTDLSNNALATKSVNVLLLSVLIVGLGKAARAPVAGRVIPQAGRSLPTVRHG